MSQNNALLVTALMNLKVPNGLIPGVITATASDFPGSKVALGFMDEIVSNAASPDIVMNLLLQIEEITTLPPGITAVIEWIKTPGTPPMEIAQVIAVIASAVHDAESWFVQHF